MASGQALLWRFSIANEATSVLVRAETAISREEGRIVAIVRYESEGLGRSEW